MTSRNGRSNTRDHIESTHYNVYYYFIVRSTIAQVSSAGVIPTTTTANYTQRRTGIYIRTQIFSAYGYCEHSIKSHPCNLANVNQESAGLSTSAQEKIQNLNSTLYIVYDNEGEQEFLIIIKENMTLQNNFFFSNILTN